MSLPIVYYPTKILRQRAKEVEEITPTLLGLLPQMEQAMQKHEGIGLAAPQIGISQRIIIVKDMNIHTNHAFFNPKLIKQSKETSTDEEGCLSLPGLFMSIKRPKKITVTCLTPQGEQVTIEAIGLGARIFQHEIDHLNGKLIINRISPVERVKLIPKLWKFKP